jgi:cytochrome c
MNRDRSSQIDALFRRSLDAYLEDPATVYKRTRMAFGGLKNAEDRQDVICYLRQSGTTADASP